MSLKPLEVALKSVGKGFYKNNTGFSEAWSITAGDLREGDGLESKVRNWGGSTLVSKSDDWLINESGKEIHQDSETNKAPEEYTKLIPKYSQTL